MSKRSTIVLASLALLAGCAEVQHVWVPTQQATAQLPESGLPAAYYQTPAGAPPGSVTIGSLGVRKVQTTAGSERAIVMRMIVMNNSDQPWRVDPRQQMLTFTDGYTEPPSAAYGSVPANVQVVDVPPRQKATIDLLYAVPAGPHHLGDLELAWSVATPAVAVSNRTPFRREDIEPSEYAYGYDYAPYYGDYYYPPPYFYPSPFFSFGLGFGGPILAPAPWVHGGYHHEYGRRTPLAPHRVYVGAPRAGYRR